MGSNNTNASRLRKCAAVTAALSLGLALGGAAVVPSTVYADDAPAASDVVWSTQRQMLTVSVRYAGDKGNDLSREVASKLSLSVTNTATGETTSLEPMSGAYSFQFQAKKLTAGTYTFKVTGVPEGVVLASSRPSDLTSDLVQVKNGETITLNGTWTDLNYAPTVLYLYVATAQSEQYDPQAQDIDTVIGGTPTAAEGIGNMSSLPKGTAATWEQEPDTSKPGDITGTVKVTYPDGTSETVDVTVHVKLRPQMLTVSVRLLGDDGSIGSREVASHLALSITGATGETTPLGQMAAPSDFQFQAKGLEAGDYTLSVSGVPEGYRLLNEGEANGLSAGLVAAYNDGAVSLNDESQYGANAVYLVLARTQSSQYTPEPKPIETEVGGKSGAEEGIGNLPDLPEGTTVTWEQEPDTSKAGDTAGTVRVTYPDGTYDLVEVSVTVKAPKAGEEKTPAKGAPAKDTAKKATKKARALPQTGDASLIATAGIAGTGLMAGLVGLIKRRRSQE